VESHINIKRKKIRCYINKNKEKFLQFSQLDGKKFSKEIWTGKKIDEDVRDNIRTFSIVEKVFFRRHRICD
jgi:hypothetical protein